ncbi:hypothetical protein LPJ71_000992, partial [Coemansia sp. S17]
RPDSKGIVAGNDLTGVETFNITENTPLLTGSTAATATPLIQVALSPANKSYASLNYRSGDVPSKFALKDIDGRVSLKGNPAELQDQGVFTKALAELESNKDIRETTEVKGKGKAAKLAKLTTDVLDEEDPSKCVNDKTPEDEYNLRRLKKIAEQRGLASNGDSSALQGTLVKDERREAGYVKSEVWLTYLNACGNKWFWIGASILLITCELMVVLHTYWIRIWVASTSSERQNHSAAYWIGIYD